MVIAGLMASNAKILEKIQVHLESTEDENGLPMPISFFVISLGGVFALIAWFVALCGCCSSMKKHRCCLISLAFFTVLVVALFFVFGALFIILGTYGDDYVEDRCAKATAG